MWWGGCAWDSFGIGAALGEPVEIRTLCPGCGRALVVHADPAGPPQQDLVVHVPCPARRWWDDVVGTCTNIRLFCSPPHVEAWAQAGPHPVGQVIPSATMWQLAQRWYGDRLDRDWSPRPAAAAQQLLEQCGLSGDFCGCREHRVQDGASSSMDFAATWAVFWTSPWTVVAALPEAATWASASLI